MNKKVKIKLAIRRFMIKHTGFYKIIYYLYKLLTDFKGRERYIRKNNNNITYYIIRPRTNCIEGLLSLYITAIRKVDYAFKKGFIPVIDMKNYKTQYSDGSNNVWEWFFKQPNGVSLMDAYSDIDSAILSGYKLRAEYDESLFSEKIFNDKECNLKSYNLMFDNVGFSNTIEQRVKQELENIPVNQCIGVYLRGTDYVKLKPAGEHVQPTAEMMIEKIQEFRDKYNNPDIFLVTEDNEIYTKIKDAFQDAVKIVSYDTFISNYKGNDFLSKSNVFKSDMRTVGENYLIKMILLSKCKYLVSSITCGSRVAFGFNGNQYVDQFIFDLGKYE